MVSDNSWLTLLLWIFLSLSGVFKIYLYLKICDNTSYFINKEVYYATYVISAIVSIIVFFAYPSYSTLDRVLFVIFIGSLILSINDNISNRIWITLVILIISTTFNSIVSSIISFFYNFSNDVQDLITLPIKLVILIFIYHLKYSSSFWSNQLDKNGIKLIKIVLIASAIFQGASASVLYSINSENLISTNISYICVILLCALTWYILTLNKKLMSMSAEQKELLSIQKEYYLALLEKEEETRRYRHDMSNHIMCLNALLEKSDISSSLTYLGQLQKQFEPMSENIYQTGNDILTAITAHYLQMIDSNTDVNITGKIIKEINISNADLCSVYSNMIKNATEELAKIEHLRPKKLEINFSNGDKFIKIAVKNTMKDPSSFKGFASKTTKEDKKNHGYGIQNINRIVSNYKGLLDIRKNNDLFLCEVIIPQATDSCS